MEPKTAQLRKVSMMNGVTYGIISFIITLLILYMMKGTGSLIVVAICGFSPWIVGIVLAIVFTIDIRKKIGGFWSFKDAVTGAFIMLFVSYLVSTLLSTIYLHLIDSGLMASVRDNVVSVQEAFFSEKGVDQATADKAIEGARKGFDEGMELSAVKLLKGVAIAAIVCFIVALILGAIFKKESPLYETADPANDE